MVKKSPGLAETDPEKSGDSNTEDTLRGKVFPLDMSLEVGKNEKKLKIRDLQRKRKDQVLQNLISTT